MAIKIRTSNTVEKDEEKFINDLVDKPYGEAASIEQRITIILDGKLYDTVDSIVRKRKRSKQDNRTISAFVREALEYYLTKKPNIS